VNGPVRGAAARRLREAVADAAEPWRKAAGFPGEVRNNAARCIMDTIAGNSDIAIWFALYHLETAHWHDVDFDGGRNAHELYCHDGVLAVGANRFKGRHGIKLFYEWRRSRGEMTSRHIITNMMVNAHEERRASASGVITIHRGKGAQPIERGNVPALVADFTSDCVLGPDNIWRYASHLLDPVFIGSDVPLSLAIDPRYLDHIRVNDSAGGEH
jgi:hypothetical protein